MMASRVFRGGWERKQVWLARYADEMNLYSSYRDHHYDLQRFIQPRRGRNLKGKNERGSGARRNGNIYDGTARVALRTLRAGLLAGMSSPMREWFRLGSWDDDVANWGPGRRWLYRAERLNYKVLEFSRAYNAFGHAYESSSQFGVGAFGQFGPGKKSAVYYDPYPVGTFIFTTDIEHDINGFMMETQMSADQLVRAFGRSNCSEPVQRSYDEAKSPTEMFRVLWVVEENDDRMPGSYNKLQRPYRSVRFEMDAPEDDKFLEESGYFRFPFMVPRWDVEHPDKWPMSSPGMDALGDVQALQKMQYDKLQQLDYRINPPMGAPTSLRVSPVSFLPGHVSFYDSVQAAGEVKPLYQVPGTIDDIRQEILETHGRIKSALYADLWQMLANIDMQNQSTQKTATEIAMLHEEKIMQLTPVLYSFDHDMLRPAILGQTDHLIRSGYLEPPPDELMEGGLKIEFVSVLAQAHALITAGSIERFNGFVGGVAEVKPEVLDVIDWDEQLRTYATMTNQPEATIRSPQAVEDIRKARAQQQQQMQMMALAAQGAESAKTLSETDLSGNSALGSLLGGAGVPVPGGGQPGSGAAPV